MSQWTGQDSRLESDEEIPIKACIADRDDDCGCTLGQDVGMTEYTGWVVSRHPECPEHNTPEIDIDPNFPDRRPGATQRCAVATNKDIRAPHRMWDLRVGQKVIAVQDHSYYNEPDWIAYARVDEIRRLEGSESGITHFIYIDVDWESFHDRPEEVARDS